MIETMIQTTEHSEKFPESSTSCLSEWVILVEKIKNNDPTGMEELYNLLSTGMRYYLCRQLGREYLDDRLHDCFLEIAKSIRRGGLREPDRLMGFIRTIVRRQIAGYIDNAIQTRRETVDFNMMHSVAAATGDPEREVSSRQQEHLALEVLKKLSSRDREILTRFYLYEQSQETICREMHLTETQFRLLKSRAKARFGKQGRRKVTAGTNK